MNELSQSRHDYGNYQKTEYTRVIMQRPTGVTITAILMAANICVDVYHALHTAPITVPNPDPATTTSHVMLLVHIGLVGLLAFEAISIIGYWLGRTWGRWLIIAGSLYFLFGLKSLPRDLHRSPFVVGMDVYSAALAVYLLWYLHTAYVRTWFQARSHHQPELATGK